MHLLTTERLAREQAAWERSSSEYRDHYYAYLAMPREEFWAIDVRDVPMHTPSLSMTAQGRAFLDASSWRECAENPGMCEGWEDW
jgi:hypothetical protein